MPTTSALTNSEVPLVTHCILDSGPIIKGQVKYHLASKFYTIPQVIREIKDAQSRLLLETLPFEIVVRQPTEESLAAVIAFSKKTGDYASLSATDLKVLALTWALEREVNGSVEHLRTEPGRPVAQVGKHSPSAIAKKVTEESEESNSENKAKEELEVSLRDLSVKVKEEPPTKSEEARADPVETPAETENNNDDDDEGWITPSNVARKKKAHQARMLGAATRKDGEEPKILPVACMTTDFAMQNVILQMKMNLVSADGVRIKKVKNWVLRCHGCYKTTNNMEKQFCPSCGNNTLIRTSCSTDADGNMVLYLKQNFQYNKRGTQYDIPAPKGGRHGDGIILREDQKEYGRALAAHRRQKNSIDPFDVDFVPLDGSSKPKSSKPMIGFGRRNVNEARRARK